MAAWLAPMVVTAATPLGPPPAAATAWACRALLDGSAFSLVNKAGWAWMTASSGANFCAKRANDNDVRFALIWRKTRAADELYGVRAWRKKTVWIGIRVKRFCT